MKLFLVAKKEYGMGDLNKLDWKVVCEEELHNYIEGYRVLEITKTRLIKLSLVVKSA